MSADAAPAPNPFGLHQFDGLSSFFGDQNFDYDGFVLPPVSTRRLSDPRILKCDIDVIQCHGRRVYERDRE